MYDVQSLINSHGTRTLDQAELRPGEASTSPRQTPPSSLTSRAATLRRPSSRPTARRAVATATGTPGSITVSSSSSSNSRRAMAARVAGTKVVRAGIPVNTADKADITVDRPKINGVGDSSSRTAASREAGAATRLRRLLSSGASRRRTSGAVRVKASTRTRTRADTVAEDSGRG